MDHTTDRSVTAGAQGTPPVVGGDGPALWAKDLVKRYRRGVLAVDQASFEVPRGEIFGFLGPNGAGKSTTILMLITLLRPTAGQARVCGYDVARRADAVRRSVGYVSQDIAVDDTLTGRQNVYLQGRFYHLPPRVIAARSAEVLAMVDLADRADDLVSTYSGGMRKRLDIAEGLIHRPAVLFLDEPTLGLDIQTRRRIWEYIERLRREQGITIFLTTHYMDEADALCDRVAIIDHGRIVAIGATGELKRTVGGDLVTLKLRGPDGRPVTPDVADLPGVEHAYEPRDGALSFVVKDGERDVPRILATLGERGLVCDSLAMKRPSLDDVFLHFTGRELRQDEGGGSFWRTSMAVRRARR